MSSNNLKPIKSENKIRNTDDSPVISTFERILTKEDLDKPVKLFREAMSYYLINKDIDKTIELLNEVISCEPAYVDAYYNLGICYSDKREIEKAISFFRKALELDNNPKSEVHQSSRFNIGNQLVIKGQYQEALEQFEMIMNENTKAIDAIYNAAYIYFKYFGQYDKAITFFERILNIFSLHLDAWYNLGLTYNLKGNIDKALELWERLVQVSPSYAPAYYNLAIINKNLGRKDKAMLFFQKYLDLPVKDPNQYTYIKYAARRLKELQSENKSS